MTGVRPLAPPSGLDSLSQVLKPPPVRPKDALAALAEALTRTTPPPATPSLGDILSTPPPLSPTLGDILADFLKMAPPKKTPAEEFTEWLLRQRSR